jgi:uncharacterized protein
MKFLVLAAVVGVVLWFTLRRGLRAAPRGRPPDAPKPVTMVRCAHCGAHLPPDEAVADADLRYCSDAHRRLGPRAP